MKKELKNWKKPVIKNELAINKTLGATGTLGDGGAGATKRS